MNFQYKYLFQHWLTSKIFYKYIRTIVHVISFVAKLSRMSHSIADNDWWRGVLLFGRVGSGRKPHSRSVRVWKYHRRIYASSFENNLKKIKSIIIIIKIMIILIIFTMSACGNITEEYMLVRLHQNYHQINKGRCKKNGIFPKGGGGLLNSQNFCKFTKLFLVCQNHS